MRAYERLLKYVKVHTTSDPNSGTHPSTLRQFDLAKILVEELKELGLTDAHVDEHCYVYATLPATPGQESAAPLGLIAHMDTADDASGENVRPQIHENYDGEAVTLPATGTVLDPKVFPFLREMKGQTLITTDGSTLLGADDASGENVRPQIHENYDGEAVTLPATGTVLDPKVFPFLREMKGQTLITTDGSTLLGADDKAGVAEIMTALERIIAENRPHGKLCIGFTPDEEIGEGASLFDVEGFGAAYAYTVDGEDVGEISYENFNAAAAVVTVHGFSVHPGSAKNSMINAQNVAMEFHAALPAFSRPEHTEGREGFFHLTSMQGDVTTAHLGYIVRDHDAAKFAARKAQMQHIAACLNERYGAGTVELDIKDSYYNMLEKIQPHFHLVENARKAIRAAGLEPIETPVRGGTDGATLSYMGLPCPNLGTGGFNFHGPCECITAEKMDQGVEILLNLVELYK